MRRGETRVSPPATYPMGRPAASPPQALSGRGGGRGTAGLSCWRCTRAKPPYCNGGTIRIRHLIVQRTRRDLACGGPHSTSSTSSPCGYRRGHVVTSTRA
eukprot:3494909-Prymnesium_polylepis.1